MSRALVVGGDRIDGIKQVLATHGITEINHWTGRKSGDGKKDIPHNIDMIVLVTDWINHSFTARVKSIASKRGISIIFTKNGATSLRKTLAKSALMESACRKAFHLYQRLKHEMKQQEMKLGSDSKQHLLLSV